MKAVLISIQPKWCELIASGKKTVEVRKTRPKLETPFKVYIYCTQGEALALPCLNNPHYTIHRMNNGTPNGRKMTEKEREQSDHSYVNGKVIGEFVCNRFVFLDAYYDSNGNRHLCNTAFIKSCVPDGELFDYLYGKHGRKHGGWAWHISDLVIYDNPRELSEFRTPCKMRERLCGICDYAVHGMDGDLIDCDTSLERPPQSWMYVEVEG